MKAGDRRSLLFLAICALLLLAMIAPGCGGGGKPKVMVFLGESSNSYSAMKPIVDSLQKKFQGKVTWVNVDYDDPKNKSQIEKYHVTLNPTIILFNTKGEIKNTFIGAMPEDMLSTSIQSFIPTEQGTGTQTGTDSQKMTPTSLPNIPNQ